jgi:hypothetical protein
MVRRGSGLMGYRRRPIGWPPHAYPKLFTASVYGTGSLHISPHLIGGQTRPSSGAVVFDGSDVTRYRPDQRATRGIRRTFQNLKLFPDMFCSPCQKVSSAYSDDGEGPLSTD